MRHKPRKVRKNLQDVEKAVHQGTVFDHAKVREGPPRYPSEEQGQKALILLLKHHGWHVKKTHGSMYSSGWPDLYCTHKEYGARWVEMKSYRPGHKLEATQSHLFAEWEEHGTPVWVCRGPADYKLLFGKPNWRRYR